MGFLIFRRKRDRRQSDLGWIALYTAEDLADYARYLERMLERRGVKLPGRRFRPRVRPGALRVRLASECVGTMDSVGPLTTPPFTKDRR